jgi:hypothetical protein
MWTHLLILFVIVLLFIRRMGEHFDTSCPTESKDHPPQISEPKIEIPKIGYCPTLTCPDCSCPDMSKYTLKSSIPACAVCPDMKEYVHKTALPDMTDYVLKSTIIPCNTCVKRKCKKSKKDS